MKALTYVEIDVPAFVQPEEDLVGATLIYNFTANSLFSWSGTAQTATATANGATLVPTGPDPIFRSPAALTIAGEDFPYVRIDIERTVVRTVGVWEGHLFWETAGHGESGSFFKNIPEVPNVVGARQIILLDMTTHDSSGAQDDWITNTITRLRLDFENQPGTPNGQFLIRSISVGAELDRSRGADFDGTNDYLTRGAGLTGAADSKLLTFSGWINIEAGLGGRIITSGGASTRISLSTVDNSFGFVAINSAAVNIAQYAAVGTPIPTDGLWHHMLLSVDMADPLKRHVYIDDIRQNDAGFALYTNDTIDFTISNWAVGANLDNSFKLNGNLADLWFAPGVYMDLSIEGNRRRFYSAKKGPQNLGLYGEVPTGTPPLVFLSGPFDTWHLNKGKGGGFTVNGALAPASEIPETHRYAIPVEYLPPSIDAVPSMKSLSFNPSSVSLGTDLGIRASITAVFGDHRHTFGPDDFNQGSYWGKWRGRYGTKLRNCKFRVLRGIEGQALEIMDTRHYLIDSTDGPTPEGVYKIVAKDVLKLADDARSQAPNISNGKLAGSITNSATSATLSPAGIGNLEYPASGWVCIGGKEIVSFTRSSDTLTITRGQLGTIGIAHNSGDRVQLVLRYTGNTVADIIYDLLINYVPGITDAMIDLDDWQDEVNAYLSVIYAATISEATSVKKLLIELIDQAALALFWDDRSQKIQLRVLREIATDTDTFDEERIVLGSLNVSEQPDKRISQIWCYYGQRDPTDQADNQDNYRAALASVDLERESEYGTPAIIKIPSRWVETLTAATRLNSIKLSRFRDPPRAFSFQLFRDQQISLATGYQLSWWANQDRLGNRGNAKIQITKIRVESDYTYVEAEEMLASGVIVLLNVMFLTTQGSVLDLIVPSSWNSSDNSIETLGGAGCGGSGGNAKKGGGAGAYSSITNLALTPGATVKYHVGVGGKVVVGPFDGTDTWFNGLTLGASSCAAKAGTAGSGRTGGGIGGLASGGIGTVKFSGGNAGNGGNSNDNPEGGGGGGGSGGPHGDGGDGGAGGPNTRNGGGGGGGDGGTDGGYGDSGVNVGGNNRFGFGGGPINNPGVEGGGGGGGNAGNSAGSSSSEQLWTQTIAPIISAGPSGGGGGGGSYGTGGSASYGGGGGGGGEDANGGNSLGGLIVLTWRQ